METADNSKAMEEMMALEDGLEGEITEEMMTLRDRFEREISKGTSH